MEMTSPTHFGSAWDFLFSGSRVKVLNLDTASRYADFNFSTVISERAPTRTGGPQ